MKKFIFPVLFALVVCLVPVVSSAKTICYSDGFSFFVLSGGRPNLKPFAGKFVNPVAGCHGTITGSIMQTAPGVSTVSFEGNPPPPCVNFAVFGTTSDPQFNFTGVFDNAEDATADGNSAFTVVNCNTVPSTPSASPTDKPVLPSKPVAGYNPPKVQQED